MNEFIYNRAKEDLQRKEMNMKQNKEKRDNRQEEKEYQLKVLKLRTKDVGCKHNGWKLENTLDLNF